MDTFDDASTGSNVPPVGPTSFSEVREVVSLPQNGCLSSGMKLQLGNFGLSSRLVKETSRLYVYSSNYEPTDDITNTR